MTALRTLTLAAGLLALAVLPTALADDATGPLASCAWNHAFTGPLEATGLVAFHDGTTCSATPFPCPDDPYRSCNPL